MEWIKKLLTPSPEKLLKPLYKQADAIDALEPTYEKLTDDQLREKTNELRARAQPGWPRLQRQRRAIERGFPFFHSFTSYFLH